jgi:hypothetical protein
MWPRHESGQRRQQDPVLRFEGRTVDLPAQCRHLVTQHQQLDVLGGIPASEKDHQLNQTMTGQCVPAAQTVEA